MEQYPYTLHRLHLSPGGVDENGHTLQGVPSFIDLGPCRDEAKKGDLVVTVGGEVSSFSTFIFTPPGVTPIEPGETVEVREASGTIRVAGTVKRFRSGQLHCRIWL